MHLILDNYGTHTHPKVLQWLEAHPRYRFHFTPTGASRLNQVERFFAELTRQRIRRGTFRCVRELEKASQDLRAGLQPPPAAVCVDGDRVEDYPEDPPL